MDDAKSLTANLDFNKLSLFYPRQFVPEDADMTCKETIRLFYQKLLECPVDTTEDMEQLILDRSELEAAIEQQEAVLYIQMTCQTDDPKRAAAYKDFVENKEPVKKSLSDQLDKKIIQAIDELSFNNERYDLYFKKMRADIELFCQKNVPLQTEDSLLSQEYQTVTGAMTVKFKGQDLPISKIRKYFYEPDRDIRRQSWKAYYDRYLQDRETLDAIFDKMVSVRQRIAGNAGFDNYRDYKFKEYHRFDYTPQHCRQYHEAVEKYLVPLQQKMHQLRAEQMNLPTLRPWDLFSDPLCRSMLKPADDLEQLTKGLRVMFSRIDKEFGSQFQMMLDEGLLDLESRKGKAPGGYLAPLFEARKSFIFGNTIGADEDFNLLAHEGGHAFHSLACADEKLTAYLQAPIEFGEVASMSMELLTAAHLDVFYPSDEQKQWWRDKLESCVRALIQIAMIDAFQHWIYENPSHSVIEREQQWITLNDRFSTGLVDWADLGEYQKSDWHRVMHFFQCPFYYIEYGIAQLGALGIWMQSREDTARAIGNYKKALTLGGSQPLPVLFAAAGLEFDFSEKTIQPLSEILLQEWQKYI